MLDGIEVMRDGGLLMVKPQSGNGNVLIPVKHRHL
jgi:hypothetical protein